ncbi:ribonuclease D [Aestuariibacter sp. A3R04]|uniref:ribonuclease D n=1 Tax=Aestuariibacter sp. A3R04 TaxID=2841571 RepID=UPI001C08D2AB|nr:ribonuclease D [Aestuariibacter sp. A3R04]MBU3023331.1 ribonuclease D [Aestuariibacter sp. A3R04]
MNYTLITDENALTALCQRAARAKAVAIDTEFVRTRTLTPQLGLLQLYDGEQLALIDPLAIDDMTSFVALMENENVVKVLHSCSEDLETFLTAFNCIPSPIFDTQVAASVLGLGPTLGYAKLVEMLCDKILDKGESRTDWLARPLRDAQLHYAANDVLYLLPAYTVLEARINQIDKYHWVTEEIVGLAEKKRAQIPPEFAYLQLKNTWRLNVEQLTVFRHLAAWRLTVARQKNIALNFVVRESQLFDIAFKLPGSRNALSNVGLPPQTFRRYSDTLLALVQEARALFEDTPPHLRLTRIKRLIDFPQYKKTMSAVKAVCSLVAQQQGVGEDVIASKKQINQVLKWQWFDNDEYRVQGLFPDLVSGWRAPLLKEQIENIVGTIEPAENHQ